MTGRKQPSWVAHYNPKMLSGTIEGCASQQNGHAYVYEVNVAASSVPSYLPDKPQDGETLNILLIGHSFGVDATEYLPALLAEAGIDNVRIGRERKNTPRKVRHYMMWLKRPGGTSLFSSRLHLDHIW